MAWALVHNEIVASNTAQARRLIGMGIGSPLFLWFEYNAERTLVADQLTVFNGNPIDTRELT